MVSGANSAAHVVIVGIETPIGATLAGLYQSTGANVTGSSLDGDMETEAARLGEKPIDIVIFADAFNAPARNAVELERSDFEAGLSRLAFKPLWLANRLRSALSASDGPGKIVLVTRTAATMTEPDPAGSYLERPFRAAAHALWKSMSVEWQPLGIDCLVIAIDDATTVNADLLTTIADTSVSPEGCVLQDAAGKPLGW
ncbi:hypothetical protein OSH11_04975 [Kaistia dalseonensis]|uniref:NAD(P)-dependent dehydrogenase (Short-subunit alcohol dehydrogenase family) n=1 Tax=Kaistia dalseonensis TaxID=410840 RepID=A0ABU0H2V1_9HYPH|nr:hypothetical protein [Kaistia dalseonensis]MCX5494042.1 hypothetical protein [Kaistia dalseonensis]MDQ0436620.1 NAD(P)-dependent dehydrogenase (short-subunit alcohol dehydrogenase family) [Kaistia dalseonensis]